MSQIPNKKRQVCPDGSNTNSPPRKCKTGCGAAEAASLPCLSPRINEKYMEQSFKDCIGKALQDGIEASHIGTQAKLINDPFTCCVLPSFVDDQSFLEGLKDELAELDYHNKSNDLYKFKQSDALQNFASPCITALKKILYEDFLSWLREVMGIPFIDTFDLTSSKYDYTDVLLCHDDELEGRRVAFILYLVPPWKDSDGGLLDLFDVDEHGQPKSVVKSLVPVPNNFVFFEVTPKSFHQVSEVLSQEKCRLSVSGWFHGPTLPRPVPYMEPQSALAPHIDTEENRFADWISECYLDFVNQSEIQETFSAESEIQLPNFLEEEKFDAVHSALKTGDIRWTRRGPANKRHYEVADPESLPPVVCECLDVLKCEYFFLLLSNLTALRLHDQAPCSSDDDNGDDDGDEDDGDEDVDKDEAGRREEREKKRMEKVGNGGEEAAEENCEQDEDSAIGDEGEEQQVEKNIGNGSQKTTNEELEQARTGNENRTMEAKQTLGGESSKGGTKGPSSIPRCRAEVRRWTHGCYTLIHDTDTEGCEYALDASIYFSAGDFDPDFGGYVSYIAKGEDEELLSIVPQDNSLALVYRDKETLRFVKHINESFVKSRGCSGSDGDSQPAFYELYIVYYE